MSAASCTRAAASSVGQAPRRVRSGGAPPSCGSLTNTANRLPHFCTPRAVCMRWRWRAAARKLKRLCIGVRRHPAWKATQRAHTCLGTPGSTRAASLPLCGQGHRARAASPRRQTARYPLIRCRCRRRRYPHRRCCCRCCCWRHRPTLLVLQQPRRQRCWACLSLASLPAMLALLLAAAWLAAAPAPRRRRARVVAPPPPSPAPPPLRAVWRLPSLAACASSCRLYCLGLSRPAGSA